MGFRSWLFCKGGHTEKEIERLGYFTGSQYEMTYPAQRLPEGLEDEVIVGVGKAGAPIEVRERRWVCSRCGTFITPWLHHSSERVGGFGQIFNAFFGPLNQNEEFEDQGFVFPDKSYDPE